MLYIKLSAKSIKNFKKTGKNYLPDFIIYNSNQNQYNEFWSSIKNHPLNELYTDGVQVYKVHWITALFETFKGWLGFENHCQINKIEMTLAKIAYFGYCRGYHEQTSLDYEFPTSLNLLNSKIREPRNSEISKCLQQTLMNYYITHSSCFPPTSQFVTQAYPFGQTFLQDSLTQFIPTLDPQDSNIIRQTIATLEDQRQSIELDYSYLSSSFAHVYSHHLVENNRFEEALRWSPNIDEHYRIPFINYYLQQKSHNDKAAIKAIKLIAALATSLNSQDQDLAVRYIREHFTLNEQANYTKPYLELKIHLANSYLVDALKENKRNIISRTLSGSKFLELLNHVVDLNPDILKSLDIEIKEQWTINRFKQLMKKDNVIEAKNLYETNPDFKFDRESLENLRNYYFEEINNTNKELHLVLNNKNYPQALQLASTLISIAKKIAIISPEDSPIFDVTIIHARTLLRIDELSHLNVKDADLEQLEIAGKMLLQIRSLNKNNNTLKNLLNSILIRKIECLIEKIKVPILFADDSEIRDNFVKAHRREINELKFNLKTYIDTNQGACPKENRPILAKIYYLMGDVLAFIESNNQESIPYFKKASEIMPYNLYYQHRYLQMANKEERHTVRNKIDSLEFSHGIEYDNWMLERWHADPCMSSGINIHAVPLKKSMTEKVTEKISSLLFGQY